MSQVKPPCTIPLNVLKRKNLGRHISVRCQTFPIACCSIKKCNYLSVIYRLSESDSVIAFGSFYKNSNSIMNPILTFVIPFPFYEMRQRQQTGGYK